MSAARRATRFDHFLRRSSDNVRICREVCADDWQTRDVTDRVWSADRVGVIQVGEHSGRFVSLDADRGGWHIFLTVADPRTGPSEGWDIWADDEVQVDEWFAGDFSSVVWLD